MGERTQVQRAIHPAIFRLTVEILKSSSANAWVNAGRCVVATPRHQGSAAPLRYTRLGHRGEYLFLTPGNFGALYGGGVKLSGVF